MGKRARDSTSAANKDLSLRLSALGVPTHRIPKVVRAVKVTPDATTTMTRYAARSGPDEFFDAMKVTKEITLKSGESWILEWAAPALLQERILEEDDSFHKAFASALAAHPPSQPWSIILGFDECWSGNILAISGRKGMVLSYAFDQFGRRRLAKSGAWIPFAVVQTRKYKECPGRWSRLARIILEHMFLSPTNGFQTVGATLTFRGRSVSLRASLICVLSDGDGIKLLYEWKGASGIRNCLCCANIISRLYLAATCRAFRHSSCSKVEEFELHVFKSLFRAVRSLFRDELQMLLGHLSKTTLNENRTSLGFAPTLEGIWGNHQCARMLDPCEHLIFDWVHNTVQDGGFSHEVIAYMSNSEAASRENLESCLDLG